MFPVNSVVRVGSYVAAALEWRCAVDFVDPSDFIWVADAVDLVNPVGLLVFVPAHVEALDDALLERSRQYIALVAAERDRDACGWLVVNFERYREGIWIGLWRTFGSCSLRLWGVGLGVQR